MTDEQKKPGKSKRPPIGSISQFATLGRGKHAEGNTELPDSQQPSSPGSQPSSSPDLRQSSNPDFQESSSSDSQQSNIPDFQMSNIPEVKNVRSLKAQTERRKQKTIYLPEELFYWLNIQAAQERREVSEVVTDAIDMYRKSIH